MIFPKQQMKIEQAYNEDLKKQALELIISLYLNRKKDEDISFLKNNFGSTGQFATGIRSSLKSGLAFSDVQSNRILYGQNQKFPPEKCLSLKECFKKQFTDFFILLSFILLISSTICAQIKNIKQMSTSSEIMLCFYGFGALIRVFCAFYYSNQLSKTSLQKTKTNKYQVIRNGHLLQIQQSQLVVGDIVELGFKQKVPATGIMLSNKQIYVKENEKRQSVRLKTNLQSCLRKIQSMSILDLKLSFEQRTLPSPIVLRGSQLLQGITYPILIISVTQQNLLKQFGYNKQDNFSSKGYNQWSYNLQKRWKKWSIYLVFIAIVVLAFGHFTDYKLLMKDSQYARQMFFQFLLQVAALILISSVSCLSNFLNVIFMKLMIKIKVIQNFNQFFTVERIIANQRNVVDYDEILISQIAVCQKIDLIGSSQINNLNILTKKLVMQINEVFGINFEEVKILKRQKKKGSKIVHVNKKNRKVISMISSSQTENQVFKEVLNQITKINETPFINTKINNYRNSLKMKKINDFERQKTGSCNFLKIPKLDLGQQCGYQQGQNLKQILHTRCRMKSKGLLDNLVQLAEKGMRTYYFQLFDLKNLEQVTHIVLNGQVTSFASQFKERMVMLARKMNLIYGLTPIMIGYNEGPYNQKPLRLLVCILGVKISQSNIVINSLKQLKEMNIRSLIFLSNESQTQSIQQEQKSVLQQYKLRGWLTNQDSGSIYNSKQIKKNLRRLICKNCWISNCDCKQKIQQVSNIQPFIQIEDKIKILYQTDEESLKFIQSAYKQLQYSLVCINSTNSLAFDIIDSILTCRCFIIKLKRSVILFYAFSIVYFTTPLLFWVRNVETIRPLQVGLSFCILITLFSVGLLCNIKKSISKAQMIQNQTNISTKQKTIFIYTVCALIILFAQLFNSFSNKIPEFQDYYDQLIVKYQLNSFVCKYGNDGTMTALFQTNQCSVPQIGLQFSRLSTFVCTYLYFTLWTLAIITHRNFTHLGSLICYLSSIFLYVCLVQLAPQIIHSYSEGLAWQHYMIISVAVVVTLIGGLILSQIICRIPITSYFNEQTQSKINFTNQNGSHYSSKLKYYYSQKKLWDLKNSKLANIFVND